MVADDSELEFYRQVEDLFSSLRGTPHILSPRDFQLLRSWWRDRVPMAAISAGLTEVFARNREQADGDPIVSLSYCRHAVKKHAARLAAMNVGSADIEVQDTDGGPAVGPLLDRLRELEHVHRRRHPAVAEVLARTRGQIETAVADLPPGQLDEHLWSLESAMLASCWEAIDTADRNAIDRRIATAAADAATDAARQRTVRALRDRELRLLLDLPRLELDG